jgi:zinc protease
MLQFRFANDAEAGRYRDAGDMAGDLLIRGTKTLNAEQLAERIDSLGARISIVGSAQSVYLRVRGERENFVPTMQLIADIVRNPAFDEKEFGFVRDRLLNGIRNGGREPGQIADRAMREHFDGLPRWHASAYRSKEEQLAAMTALKLEDVRAFHRDFYGTADGEIAVVGDFDPEVATREFTTLFAGWPSKHPYARMRDPYFAPAQSVRRVFETPDKPNAVLTSQARFRMADNDPDHPALLVAARVFGGGVKGSRLGLRIREREGLSYYVGSGVIINPMDDNATFYMQGTAAPENIPRVEAAMKEELTRFIDKGITPTELADAKAELLSALRDNTTSDGGIAESLRLAMFLKRDPMWDARFVKAVEAVTVADVNAAIRKHLRPSDISYFIAGDFARVARDAKALAATKPPARQ